ncbi:hypothetical protein CCAX7_60040 [Capsulimonas corticalis]|uniref:Uncharacterized protein n=1 Tax=Capsulimonas corticalis TaxID=2219043 RepID=A0A402CZH1_9BACT|nr:hypothetical protein [Capsulimonas corticalis]BDI33953.1 hypothetical protein CCAX7_60040 [Capsulimonas corticalis]
MTEEFEQTFEAVSKVAWQLRYDWITFVSLYGDAKSVEILNGTAPEFFGVEQGRLVDHVILGLSRLFDPAFSMGDRSKANLTLPAIIDLLSDYENQAFVTDIKLRLKNLKSNLKSIIDERNKRIAHIDRQKALEARSVLDFSRTQFEDSLKEIERILNNIQSEILNGETDFEAIDSQAKHHATILIRCLQKAV